MFLFSARQHIRYSALYAIARPSVRPSHGWISQRRFKIGSRNLHHSVAAWFYTVSQKNCANLFFAPCLSNMNRFQ